MPTLPFKHVQSCSTSVSGYEPENLLDIYKKSRSWKGVAGKDSNTVILRLEKEDYVRNVDIGNEFSAFIEVLVSKSCELEAIFSVLIPSTSFMDPIECRNERNGNRVKMFGPSHMNSSIAAQKWDLVKITCKQPFNKRLHYGIAFVRLTGGDEDMQNSPVMSPNLALSTISGNFEDGTRPLHACNMRKCTFSHY
uniref:XRCC1_N domain-containing protein n=1 Tax=Heterorhabditis bacteriophora TaxID=37862 RepID=A0A1I7WVN0_HETBA